MTQSNLKRGALAGLIAGIVLGVLLQVVAVKTPGGNRVVMMELIGTMSGSRQLWVGWIYHLFDCFVIGAIFGALLGPRTWSYSEGIKHGTFFALAWWFLGGIFLIPIFFGLSIFSPQTLEPLQPVAVQSLIGHLLFGSLLGGVFVALRTRAKRPQLKSVGQEESERERVRFKSQ